jgi:hypothetical protein
MTLIIVPKPNTEKSRWLFSVWLNAIKSFLNKKINDGKAYLKLINTASINRKFDYSVNLVDCIIFSTISLSQIIIGYRKSLWYVGQVRV